MNIDASGETPDAGRQSGQSWPSVCCRAAGVDAVSGSTMTSDAMFTAMDDCLAQAAQ